jgi:hypothetical protein
MKVELSDSEMICLMFWYAGFKDCTILQPIDVELYEKLKKLFGEHCKNISLYDCGVTGMPRYQPGGEHDVENRIRNSTEEK